MSDKREVLEIASTLSLLPNVVEKDYVLGWLLAGIYAHPELVDNWVFKGGTCLKKCYFETYRFSEDLDFTLRDEQHLDEGFLRRVLSEVVAWVADASGLAMPADQIFFDIYQNPRGRTCCQGKVGYRGPVSPTSSAGGWPKIKLDLTADERLVLPAVRREVFHPYSDRPEDGIWINSYAYEEAFGEKFRALAERTRPRDLYDVVNLYRRTESRPSPVAVRDVLQQKCDHKGIALPTLAALEPHRADLESMWVSMLGHQLPKLPPVSDFWAALPEIFGWMMGELEAPQRASIETGTASTSIRTRVLPVAIPTRTRGPLETIRFAAANYLCVDLEYEGKIRRIEPYSLRQTADGNYVLHAVRSEDGQHRSYRIDRIQGASVASESFTPRYVVELTSEGPQTIPLAARGAAGRPSVSSARREGPVHVYRCPTCGKTFRRKKMDSSLNPHKARDGYPCDGRIGIYEESRYG